MDIPFYLLHYWMHSQWNACFLCLFCNNVSLPPSLSPWCIFVSLYLCFYFILSFYLPIVNLHRSKGLGKRQELHDPPCSLASSCKKPQFSPHFHQVILNIMELGSWGHPEVLAQNRCLIIGKWVIGVPPIPCVSRCHAFFPEYFAKICCPLVYALRSGRVWRNGVLWCCCWGH